jgi:hypothetical protein
MPELLVKIKVGVKVFEIGTMVLMLPLCALKLNPVEATGGAGGIV